MELATQPPVMPLTNDTPAPSTPSLEGLHSTVPIPPKDAGFWRSLRAFAGPAFLVSVGYMDPGNWGTDLKAGALYKYELLWVVAGASFMAIIMQICAAKLGIVTGKDLAQACSQFYRPDALPAMDLSKSPSPPAILPGRRQPAVAINCSSAFPSTGRSSLPRSM